MKERKDIHVSALIGDFTRTERNFPITPRENIMKAFNHEKPMWMPNLLVDSQHLGPGGIGFVGIDFMSLKDGDEFFDMWGTRLRYSEAQGSPTPVSSTLSTVTKWKEEVYFPDYNKVDIISNFPGVVRDETKASFSHVESIAFEQLHMHAGVEQALIDLITEPEACREFFEYNVDYQLEIFKRQFEAHHFDYIMYHDDWGTQRAPFFSVDLFKETILPPTIRFCKEIQKSGCKFVFHNCGLIDSFMPYIIDDIGVDGLQIQHINDIKGILTKYGDRVACEYQNPDPVLLFDPDTTEEQVRSLGRTLVDEFGAHTNPGPGCVVSINTPNADVFNWIDEEICNYSLEKYRLND